MTAAPSRPKIVMDVLLAAGEPLTAAQVGVRACPKLDPRDARTLLSHLYREGRVSRKKAAEDSYNAYYLSYAQKGAVLYGTKFTEEASLLSNDAAGQLPAKLRFLQGLLERPAFQGNAILRGIVEDYRATLERRIESEDAEHNAMSRRARAGAR